MGRRTLSIASGFLPVLMGEGVHHYSVHKDAVPMDCRIVDARMDGGGRNLILLLESGEWEGPSKGEICPPIDPTFVRNYCSDEHKPA